MLKLRDEVRICAERIDTSQWPKRRRRALRRLAAQPREITGIIRDPIDRKLEYLVDFNSYFSFRKGDLERTGYRVSKAGKWSIAEELACCNNNE